MVANILIGKKTVTIAEYILGNIEEVLEDFDNKQYEIIIKECIERVVAKNKLSAQYFISHSDHGLSTLAIDLLHSPYEYSPGWGQKGTIYALAKNAG